MARFMIGLFIAMVAGFGAGIAFGMLSPEYADKVLFSGLNHHFKALELVGAGVFSLTSFFTLR